MDEYCEWTKHLSTYGYLSYHYWKTNCGNTTIVLMENGICPYCGKEIKIIHVENTKKNNYKEIKKENRND